MPTRQQQEQHIYLLDELHIYQYLLHIPPTLSHHDHSSPHHLATTVLRQLLLINDWLPPNRSRFNIQRYLQFLPLLRTWIEDVKRFLEEHREFMQTNTSVKPSHHKEVMESLERQTKNSTNVYRRVRGMNQQIWNLRVRMLSADGAGREELEKLWASDGPMGGVVRELREEIEQMEQVKRKWAEVTVREDAAE